MNRKKPLLGVTGIIGSGKSTVAKLFGKLESALFDSDKTAREITQEPETLQEIQQQFCTNVFNSTGQLDRIKMAEFVFKNPDQLKKLNKIIHPKVRVKMWEFVEVAQKDSTVKMIIVDSPLIYETDLYKYLDFIVVVAASEENCIERVKARNRLSRKEIIDRMSRQLPLKEKIKRANFVIHNDNNVEDLTGQVEDVFKQIITQWSRNP